MFRRRYKVKPRFLLVTPRNILWGEKGPNPRLARICVLPHRFYGERGGSHCSGLVVLPPRFVGENLASLGFVYVLDLVQFCEGKCPYFCV